MNDISGKTFGRLTVVSLSEIKNSKRHWECKCICGNIRKIQEDSLTHGRTKSCGCLRTEVNIFKGTIHGLRKHSLYGVWDGMINRCYRDTCEHYKSYGGRGISICDEWRNDFVAFYNWSTNNGYEKGLTIDRIDNEGNYEPSNCKWSTRKQQQANRRNTIFIEIDGAIKSLSEWSDESGISKKVIDYRIRKGWIPSEAVFKPINTNYRRKRKC